MPKNNHNKFTCPRCGSNKLAYHEYVKCITPVLLQENGHMEYMPSQIDEDDYMPVENTFICMSCEQHVEYCGHRLETEKDLLDYLELDPEIRNKQQQEYQEQLDAMIDAQDQQDNTAGELLDSDIYGSI